MPMSQILDTGIKNSKNVLHYVYGTGSLKSLGSILIKRRKTESDYAIFYVDEFFSSQTRFLETLPVSPNDLLSFVKTSEEPTTEDVNNFTAEIIREEKGNPFAIIGV